MNEFESRDGECLDCVPLLLGGVVVTVEVVAAAEEEVDSSNMPLER